RHVVECIEREVSRCPLCVAIPDSNMDVRFTDHLSRVARARAMAIVAVAESVVRTHRGVSRCTARWCFQLERPRCFHGNYVRVVCVCGLRVQTDGNEFCRCGLSRIIDEHDYPSRGSG